MNKEQMAQMEDLLRGGGTVSQRLLQSGMNVNALRTNATLRHEEWQTYDTAVVEAFQKRLVGVADLKSRGLVYDLSGKGLAQTVLMYEDMSDMDKAELSMDGVTRGKNDAVEFSQKFLPLPIAHKEYQINIRQLNMSRLHGIPLDVSLARGSSRKVAELVEDMLFNGYNAFNYGGGRIYGYTDCPTRNTLDMAKDWATSASGEEIVADVQKMIQQSVDARHYGPWVLYIPTGYSKVLGNDYKANSDKTVRTRLLELDGISDIKVADFLEAGNVILVEMVAETVRMVTGLPVTNVEWQANGNMVSFFKVMTIDVPQVRADQYGRSGIVHLAADVEDSTPPTTEG